MTALEIARTHLYRALEAERSMMRMRHLYCAYDALSVAGRPRWAEIAEAAAWSIGGGDGDVRRLMLDIEQEIERKDRAA